MNRYIETALLMALALMLALSPVLAGAEAAQPVDIIDSLGRAVTIESVPERIVSMSPSNTEILYALGAGDRVVGVDTYSDYPEEAAALESKVGTYTEPNVELIVSLEPDIVFADNNLQQDTIDQLESLGVTVVSVTGTTYERRAQGDRTGRAVHWRRCDAGACGHGGHPSAGAGAGERR